MFPATINVISITCASQFDHITITKDMIHGHRTKAFFILAI